MQYKVNYLREVEFRFWATYNIMNTLLYILYVAQLDHKMAQKVLINN